MSTTAGYLARRAGQKERVRLLYRRALKDTLNWAVHRHLFYQDVSAPLPHPPPISPPPRGSDPVFFSRAGVRAQGQVRGQQKCGKTEDSGLPPLRLFADDSHLTPIPVVFSWISSVCVCVYRRRTWT